MAAFLSEPPPSAAGLFHVQNFSGVVVQSELICCSPGLGGCGRADVTGFCAGLGSDSF